MKKLVLALTAIAAFTAPALAADMAVKAPRAAPVAIYNWTGFYIFGGVGGGLWAADTSTHVTATGVGLTINQRQGGAGWFGTVGAGYDWQFNSPWVAGIFGDGQFGDIRGTIQDPVLGVSGTIRLRDSSRFAGRSRARTRRI